MYDFKAPPSKVDLSLGTSERAEIFSICWDCSEEAVVKFLARYLNVGPKYGQSTGQK